MLIISITLTDGFQFSVRCKLYRFSTYCSSISHRWHIFKVHWNTLSVLTHLTFVFRFTHFIYIWWNGICPCCFCKFIIICSDSNLSLQTHPLLSNTLIYNFLGGKCVMKKITTILLILNMNTTILWWIFSWHLTNQRSFQSRFNVMFYWLKRAYIWSIIIFERRPILIKVIRVIILYCRSSILIS